MPERSDVITVVAYALAAICGLLLIPIVLPIAVATNAKGVVERLSFIPGVSPDGGFFSGFTAAALLLVLAIPVAAALSYAGVAPAVVTADQSSDSPPASSTAVPPSTTAVPAPTATTTPTVRPTPTRTPTVTPTATPWPTAQSPTPGLDPDYREFTLGFYTETADLTDVPIRIRGHDYRNGQMELVYNATAQSENASARLKERGGIVTAYAQILLNYDQGKISGKAPTRLYVYEINNTGQQPEKFYINSSVAREYASGQIDVVEYTTTVYSTISNQTESDMERVRELDRENNNVTAYAGQLEETDAEE